MKVRKLRPDRSQVFEWEGDVLRQDDEGIVLRAAFNVDVVELGFTTFRRGDVFYEFYYWDRWYNVFQIFGADGSFKGWYANLGQPAEIEDAGTLCYVDLALDVWVHPDGTFIVLDEDEYADVIERYSDVRAKAEHGQEDLMAMVKRGAMPTWS